MNILLVDDSHTMRLILRNVIVKNLEATIIEAVDGKDALDKLNSNQIDLMFLDVNMPNMDGLTLLKTVRGMDQFKNLKIVMCTSESEKSTILGAIKLGATSYVVKPFSPDVLQQKLKDLKLI